MHVSNWKKPIWKSYILHNSNYITLWRRENYEKSKKISGLQGLRGRKTGTGKHRGFLGQWKYCDTVLVGTHVVTNLWKSVGCAMPRVNADVNYGLWMKTMHQCRFISCNRCTTGVRDFDNGGDYVCVRAEAFVGVNNEEKMVNKRSDSLKISFLLWRFL